MSIVETSTSSYEKWKRLLMACLFVLDAVVLFVSMWLAAYVRFGELYPQVKVLQRSREVFYPQLFPVLLGIWLLILLANRLYDFDSLFWGSGEFTRVANSVTAGLVVLVFGSFALKMLSISRGWMLLSWGLALVAVSIERVGFRGVVSVLRRKGFLASRTLVVGCNDEANVLFERARRDTSGLSPIGFLWGRYSSRNRNCQMDDLAELGDHAHVAEVVARNRVDCVLIASTDFAHDDVTQMVQSLRGLPVDLHVSSGLFEILTSRVLVKEVGGVPMVTIRRVPLTKWNLFVKRVFDLVLSISMVVLLSPVWFLLGLLIKLSSRGPVLYRHERIGRDGEHFMMYKFRTMVADADQRREEVAHLNEAEGLLFKIHNDPRVTRIGRWMRKFSIDEFPQLVNVIKGEMSLVGPRPPLPDETDKYNDWHRRRLEVPPGMSGLWQISGRSDLSFDDAVRLDIYYIENWSPRLDATILLRTIPVVLFPKGAY